MPRKRHTPREIAAKLTQATELAAQGKLQSEIARTLGVSVMTLHRWRKAAQPPEPPAPSPGERGASAEDSRVAELRLENARLRRLITDLLLEKMKLEEARSAKPGRTGER
jgi:transposase-like protein